MISITELMLHTEYSHESQLADLGKLGLCFVCLTSSGADIPGPDHWTGASAWATPVSTQPLLGTHGLPRDVIVKDGGVAAGLDRLGLGAFLGFPSVSHPPQETGLGLAGTCK